MSEEQRPPTEHTGTEIVLVENDEVAPDARPPITIHPIQFPIDPEKVVAVVRRFLSEMAIQVPLDRGRHHYLKLCFSVSSGCWSVRGYNQRPEDQ